MTAALAGQHSVLWRPAVPRSGFCRHEEDAGFQNQEREVIFLKNNTKAPGNCWSPELFYYHTASQIPLPAPRGHRSCGVAFCRFLWYSLSRKALSNQTQAAIAPHRSRCLALRSKAGAGGQLFGVPLPTLTAKGGMPYDYIGNSIAFPDDHRTVGTSRKCCTSDGRPEKG